MGAVHRAILAGILAVFVLLCVGFNLLTPIYEGHDELEHVEYVMFVRETWSIPELPHPIFEAVQPPAYYFLQAGVAAVLGLPAPPPGIGNPQPVGPDNPLFFEHPASERDHPLSGGVGTVRALRAVSTLLGVLTLLLVHATARTLFPGRETLALVITGTAAFVPQFVAVHALVNNDAPAILAGALLPFAVARLMVEADDGSFLRYAALAGVALGLGLLAKGYALASIPVPFLALAWASLGRRALLRGAAVAAGAALLLSGWLLALNLSRYGEPWPDRVAQEHIARELPQSIVDRSPFDTVFRDVFLRELRDSYWYRGGFGQVQAPAPVYLVLDLLTLGLLVGAVGALFAPARAGLDPAQKRILGVFGAAIVLQVAGIVYYNLSIQQFQGRWLFSVQAAIAVWMVVGLRSLVPARLSDAVLAALPVGLAGLTVYTLFGVAAPAFAPPA